MLEYATPVGCAPSRADALLCRVWTASRLVLVIMIEPSPHIFAMSRPIAVDVHVAETSEHIPIGAVYDSTIRAWRRRDAYEDPLQLCATL